jgi:carboxyl-terminal processing protease
MHRTAAALFLALALAAPTLAQDQPVATKVSELLTRMKQADSAELWNHALALEELGAPAAPEITRQLDAAPAQVKVAGAKAVLSMSGADAQRGKAVQALKDVVRGDADRELRILAADLLGVHGNQSEVAGLRKSLDGITDPLVKIHLLKALRLRGRYGGAARDLRKFLRSDSFGVRCEAALALAEIGNIAAGKAILSQIKDEPTDRGRRAKAYLELDEMVSKLEKFGGLEKESDLLKMRDRKIQQLQGQLAEAQAAQKQGGGSAKSSTPGGALMEELFEKIRSTYVDADKTKLDDLVDAAASGIADHLDPFSSYMSEDVLTQFNSSIRQRYGGIGAVVQMDRKSGYMTIQRPFPGNPAYEAGLRTLDQVTEVEGVSTKGKSVSDLVSILKGPPETPVTVKVLPFLGGEERDVQIVRKEITLKSTRWDMLPGNIGYLQLNQFGHLATQEVETALQDLEKRGMEALIFDLRGNPGGLLSAAVEIADKFLDDDQLVVYSEGRKGTRYGMRQDDGGPPVRARRLRQPKHPDYPLVILINDDAASASEIVSGALQVHERAELVGTQTFGKGSVQNIFPLASKDAKAALRMTIAYYYLPDGRCIHRPRDVDTWRFREQMRREIDRWERDGLLNETQIKELREQYEVQPGGVEPDYRVEAPELDKAKARAYAKVFELEVLNQYIKDHWAAHKTKLHQLARWDGFDPSAYPNFDALWAKATEALDDEGKAVFTKNDLRLLLRTTVRRFTQDDLARELTSDFQEDVQLQAGILVLAERLGKDLSGVEQLSFIKKNFPSGVARTRKPQAPKPEGGEKAPSERDFK